MLTKYREFFSTLFVTDFQLGFSFEQTPTVTVFEGRGIMPYNMMAKSVRALELYYPMVQFLINTKFKYTLSYDRYYKLRIAL